MKSLIGCFLVLLAASVCHAQDWAPLADVPTPIGTLVNKSEGGGGARFVLDNGKLNAIKDDSGGNLTWRVYTLDTPRGDWSIQVPVTVAAVGELHLSINDLTDDTPWNQPRLDVWFDGQSVHSNHWTTSNPLTIVSMPATGDQLLGVSFHNGKLTSSFNGTPIQTIDAWPFGPQIGVTEYAYVTNPTPVGKMIYGDITAVPEPSLWAWLGLLPLIRRRRVEVGTERR